MAEVENKNTAIRCPKCGATDVVLDEESGQLKCIYCKTLFGGTKVNKDDADDIEKLNGTIIGDGAKNIIPDEKVVLTLKCPACGAEVVIDANESQTARCHWCRHLLSVTDKLPNGATPDMVLPFSIEKAVAKAKIENFVNARKFFANPTFRSEFSLDNVMGVYMPYMVVDINMHATFAGVGEHLVRKYLEGTDNNKTTYYDADSYQVYRDFDLLVDDLTVEASKARTMQNWELNSNHVINAILPFDTENAVAWDPRYLRGYASEKRDMDTVGLDGIAAKQAEDIARYKSVTTAGFYDRGLRWGTQDIKVKGAKWKSAYLPIWLYSYMEKSDKGNVMHYVAVNARTGEVSGSVPVHRMKLVFISLFVEIIGAFLGMSWMLYWLDQNMDDNPALLGLIGFTPGFIFYWLMMARYRSMNARHKHESETKSDMKNLKAKDELIQHKTHLTNARIEDENGAAVLGSFSQNSGANMVGAQIANVLGVDPDEAIRAANQLMANKK